LRRHRADVGEEAEQGFYARETQPQSRQEVHPKRWGARAEIKGGRAAMARGLPHPHLIVHSL
jgi:hypothetical protein